MSWLKRILIGLAALIGLLVLVLAIGFFATRGDYVIPATAADDSTLPTIALNGAVFHSETFGDQDNPVIIVVHGGPGADYRALLELQKLADDYYVVFYDQRGSGLSPRVTDTAELTYDLYVEDLDAFVDHFGQGEPVHLIGHSFGGMLVSTYAARYPAKVDGLVLAEPGPLTNEMAQNGPNVSTAPLTVIVQAMLESLHIQNPPDNKAAMDHITEKVVVSANPGYWCGGVPHESVAGWRFSFDASRNVMGTIINDDGELVDIISGIEQFENPVLFLAASCNTVIGEAFQRQQMSVFNSAELVVIDDAGHELIAEQPEATLAAVRSYLDAD